MPPKMRTHENSVIAESGGARGEAGAQHDQIDSGSFGGRSGERGSVPTSDCGETATIVTIRSLRLTVTAIESTPAK